MRDCPVCGLSATSAPQFLMESIDHSRLSASSFASRKVPEFMNHLLVRCRGCDVVFAPKPPSADSLATAYHTADYDSADEAADAARSYDRILQAFIGRLPQHQAALEIGTGTGVLLERLSAQGFSEVIGVEPSLAAVAAAPEARRTWIRVGVFNESDFEPESFDLICCMMTLEHVADPAGLARAAYRLLRPGGAFVVVVHDYRAPLNRLLGRKSPIIDIEHLQLFSRRSARRLLETTGFSNIIVRAFANSYALSYWLRISPIPQNAKRRIDGLSRAARIDRLKLRMNVGNIFAGGFKAIEAQGGTDD